ncbi:MAG: hypothetical protein WCH39_11265 [Schlesneria sp.]
MEKLTAVGLANLSRARHANGRLGGHFIPGHLNGIRTVDLRDCESKWVKIGFKVLTSIAIMMAPKGSASADVFILTVVSVETVGYTFDLIPHTLSFTTSARRLMDQTIKNETDTLRKYAKRYLFDQRLA